jgi:hypothetical protein
VQLNGTLAGSSSFRTNGHVVHVRVGTSVTNVVINYLTCTLGPYQSVFAQNFDGVGAPNLPSGWNSSSTGAQSGWTTSSTVRDTTPNAAFSAEAAAAGISELTSPTIAISSGQSQLAFRQSIDMEPGWDGGVLELKIGAGAFTDIAIAGGVFVNGGYTHSLGTSSGNPLGGSQAWSGNSGGFFLTVVDLPAAAIGQNVQFRWRCATDSNVAGNGWRVDTISVSNRNYACSAGVNTNAPVLTAQTNRTIAEFSPLTVVNTASDTDASDILSYTLLTAPATAAIDSQGIISWTPGEGYGGTVNTFTTRVTDNGSPPLSATNSFTVTVIESNSGPILPTQSNRSIAEGTALNVTNTATDPDVPPNVLTYELLVAPAGANINSQGIITWTTTESTGPSTNIFATRVTDDGTPALSTTNSFTVTVTEVNSAPLLPAQTGRTIAGFTTLTVTNSATDPDLPANALNYTLAIAPAGATISAGGVIDWTPGGGASTNLFRTVVTDNGSPPLSATNTFTVTVVATAAPTPVLDSTALIAESCNSTNNAIDPGEQVTINFAFRNIGAMPTTNLVITLLATGGVAGPTGPQNYGVLASGDPPVGRSFSFTAVGTCGGSLTASLQMQDGLLNLGTAMVDFQLGTTGTVFTQNFDTVTAPALPVSAGWSAQSGGIGMVNWYTTNSLVDTGPNAVFSRDPGSISSNILTSPVIALPLGNSQLTFRQRHVMEADATDPTIGFDGGVLEIKIGAGPWEDIVDAGGSFVTGEYNSVISPDFGNPLGNRPAWSGTSNAFYTTMINLPADAAGQDIQLRWFFASDNGNGSGGWRIDSVGLKGALCCVNSAPIAASPTNRTIPELSLMTVTNTALDSGVPVASLNYSLTVNNTVNGAQAVNANISSAGIITWTPTEAQGPGIYLFKAIAANSSVPSLAATNTFVVTVNEVNSTPLLPTVTAKNIPELSTLTVTNTASDSDVPANVLSYTLLNPPANASINAQGIITFTPTEAQGPSTNTITTVVSDGTVSATNSFAVTVSEVNTPPTLTVISQKSVTELATLIITNTASDSDLPPNLISYSLLNPPANVVINSQGVITCTPSEAQGPSTNIITTVASDGSASATNSFVVIVTEVNTAPALPAVGEQTITELSTLIVTNSASDPDLPANTLIYNLINPPANAAIDGQGVITFTPDEAQGPSTNIITTVVHDGTASATNSFSVIVTEVNVPPSLPAVDLQTIAELSTLIVTNKATDPDLPANELTYQLINGPSNAAINSQGIISFAPTEAEGPSTNVITTIVSDGSASATNSFTVIVTEVNTPPSLPVVGDQTIPELSTMTVTNTATDPDVPANVLTYSLLNPPANVSINAQGILTFTPSEAQGPSTNTITTVVSDGSASATNSFRVIVTEVNTPPLLPVLADQVINELTTLTITNTASDEDLVGNSSLVNDLSYALVNPPAHASIDLHGIITFTPDETQGPSTNMITTIVSDGSATATNSFTVIVNEVNAPPSLPMITQRVMDELTVLIVTNSATDLDVPANTLAYTLVDPPLHATIDASGVITFAPDESQGPSTNIITTIVSDGSATATNSFIVIVNEVDAAPVLSIQSDHVIRNYKRLCVTNTATDSDFPVETLIYTLINSPPSASINDAGVIVWTPNEGHCPHTNHITTVVTDSTGLSATNSFAVVVTEPPVPVILSLAVSNGTALITWSTVLGESYRLQYKNDLSDPSWLDISPVAEADGDSLMRADDISGVSRRYYRVILLP